MFSIRRFCAGAHTHSPQTHTYTHALQSAVMQEFSTSAEEMRHNLLAIYQKLGKSFDVSDIAARFS